MKQQIINYINYLYVYVFKRKYIYKILLAYNDYKIFQTLNTGKISLVIIHKNVNKYNTIYNTTYKVISSEHLLIK